jgi:hypothetical protein
MRPVYIVSPILQPLSETRSRIVGYSLARWTGLDREHIGDFPT